MDGKQSVQRWNKNNKLTVITDIFINNNLSNSNKRRVICECSCWNKKEIGVYAFSSWSVKSCWCLQKEQGIINWKNNKVHWMFWTRIYNVWGNMKQRCYNNSYYEYRNYWWRWITICDKRKTFEWFYEDMQKWYRNNLTIERINNDWNYCLENCKRATRKEQANNRRSNHLLESDWKIMTISQWAKKKWLTYGLILDRLKKWWAIEKVLNKKTKGRTN